jgi:hypothetical protein
VDRWTRFTDDFTHLKNQEPAKDRPLLLTVILADAINLGLHKMAEACPGTSIAKLSWLSAWHIRDETYSKALARLVNHQHRQPFAAYWGEGTTSSSDGQQFRAGGRGEQAGQVNLRYGTEPGVLFYTHVSDQYAPFHTKVINATVRDATHVLDGLLYHESDLKIEEHYTDTAGFTDHVFAPLWCEGSPEHSQTGSKTTQSHQEEQGTAKLSLWELFGVTLWAIFCVVVPRVPGVCGSSAVIRTSLPVSLDIHSWQEFSGGVDPQIGR